MTDNLYCIRYKKNNKPVAIALDPNGKHILIDNEHCIETCNYWWEKSNAEEIIDICFQTDKDFKNQYYADKLTENELCEVIGIDDSKYFTMVAEEFKKIGVIK